jgi:hypothetical protein
MGDAMCVVSFRPRRRRRREQQQKHRKKISEVLRDMYSQLEIVSFEPLHLEVPNS